VSRAESSSALGSVRLVERGQIGRVVNGLYPDGFKFRNKIGTDGVWRVAEVDRVTQVMRPLSGGHRMIAGRLPANVAASSRGEHVRTTVGCRWVVELHEARARSCAMSDGQSGRDNRSRGPRPDRRGPKARPRRSVGASELSFGISSQKGTTW
jgi:hypothetical protein